MFHWPKDFHSTRLNASKKPDYTLKLGNHEIKDL